MATFSALIREWLLTGRQGGWRRMTVEQYAWHVGKFAAWLEGRDIYEPSAITTLALREWGAGLRDQWAPATCRVATIAVRGWLRWCYTEGLLGEDMSKTLKVRKPLRRAQRTVTPEEVQKLLAACHEDILDGRRPGVSEELSTIHALRNAALITLMYDTLLRNSEICRLNVEDLNFERRLLIVETKGGRVEAARFGEGTAAYLHMWLRARPVVADHSEDALFLGLSKQRNAEPGRRLTPSGLRSIFRRLSKRADIPLVSPHAFRRGGSVRMVENGAPTRLVRDFGRWHDLGQVETYTQMLDSLAHFDHFSPVGSLARNSRRPAIEWLKGDQ